MKKLGKLSLNEIHEINEHEMKLILGGTETSAYVACKLTTKNDACSDDTKGKACKIPDAVVGPNAGTCVFVNKYGNGSNECRCE